MNSFAFSTEDLPAGFDDRARTSAWRDFLSAAYAPMDVVGLPDRSFAQRVRGSRFDESATPVDVLRFSGTTGRIVWKSRAAAAPSAAHLVLSFNRRATPISLVQVGREVLLDAQTAVLTSCIEAGEMRAKDPHDVSAIAIDQARLRELVHQAEDLLAVPLPANGPAVRHLRRYLDILPTAEEAEANPDLLAHVGTTLTDLVALSLGATRAAMEVARMRGLRAARLHEIVKVIRARFADPAFAPHDVARRMGVSERYVQDLLGDAGASFTERVLELRLQCARAMLADPRHDARRIGEIAAASGFNEIPYFNRCFRRRFGATPTQFRGRG